VLGGVVGIVTLVTGCALFAMVAVLGGTAASAATAGHAEIVIPGSTTPLSSGGSATQFGVLLPGGARCPGDSTKSPWYTANSYLVPEGTDPATIDFKKLLPAPGLFLIGFGGPWEAQSVERDTALVEVPEYFNIQRFQPSDLLPGGATAATWEAGIACADDRGVASTYWNVELTFSASSSDRGGFVWKVDPTKTASKSSPWPVVAGLVVVGAVALLVMRSVAARPKNRGPQGRPAVGARR
jgi:hypothetical protein